MRRALFLSIFTVIPVASCQCGLNPLEAVPGRVAGILCDTLSGLPAPSMTIDLVTAGGAHISGTTDEAGNFLVNDVPAGKATLNLPTRKIDVVVTSDATTIVTDAACRDTPDLPGTGDIAGTICNRHTGSVVKNATVTVTLASGDALTTTTDDAGNFRVRNVPAGPEVVTVDGSGFRRTWAVDVVAGETSEIPSEGDCRNADANEGMLSGQFCDGSEGGAGSFLTGATVVVTDANGDTYSEITDAAGTFLLGPLAIGVASITVDKGSAVHMDLTAVIEAGVESHVTGGGSCVPEVCKTSDVVTEGSTELMFVIDRSGSMQSGAPGYAGTRWEGIVGAIEQVTSELQPRIAFGVELFPALSSNECGAGAPDIAPDFNDANAVKTLLDDFYSEPAGATPTTAALTSLQTWILDHPTDRKRAVLVATDGAPNCNDALDPQTCVCSTGDNTCATQNEAFQCLDDVAVVNAVSALHALGLDVYVIGIAGVEDNFGYVMDNMATAGGTERHYIARDVQALKDAMVDVARRAGGCTIKTTRDLAGVSSLDVVIGTQHVAHDAQRQNGYDIVDANDVELYGDACASYLETGTASLQLCSPETIHGGRR